MSHCDVGGKYAMIQNDRLNSKRLLLWFIVINNISIVAKNRKNLSNVLDNYSD